MEAGVGRRSALGGVIGGSGIDAFPMDVSGLESAGVGKLLLDDLCESGFGDGVEMTCEGDDSQSIDASFSGSEALKDVGATAVSCSTSSTELSVMQASYSFLLSELLSLPRYMTEEFDEGASESSITICAETRAFSLGGEREELDEERSIISRGGRCFSGRRQLTPTTPAAENTGGRSALRSD